MVEQTHPTVGLLYAGEMGASLAAVLRARGVRVVTTLRQRSDRTAARCRESGIVVLDGLREVVRESDVVLSVVSPAAAEAVVSAFCEHSADAPLGAIFVELNSIGPDLAVEMADRVHRRGRHFVDAAVNGLARTLATTGTLYLSGPRARDVERLFAGAVRVRVLGNEPGRASAMKMLLSGISKGVCALFTELALVARRRDMLDEMLEATEQIYPGVRQLVDRMLPTYALHAQRRAAEMGELELTARACGVEPCAIAAVRELHNMLAESPPDASAGSSLRAVIEQLGAGGLLARPDTPGGSSAFRPAHQSGSQKSVSVGVP